jgi:hypothetical protein
MEFHNELVTEIILAHDIHPLEVLSVLNQWPVQHHFDWAHFILSILPFSFIHCPNSFLTHGRSVVLK